MITLNKNGYNQTIALNQTISNGIPIKSLDVVSNDLEYLCLPNIQYSQNIIQIIFNYFFSLSNNMITNILHQTANILMYYQQQNMKFNMVVQYGKLSENLLFSTKTMVTNNRPNYVSMNIHTQYFQNYNINMKTIIGQELPTGILS